MTCPSCFAENAASATRCTQCGADFAERTAVVVAAYLSPGSLFAGRYEIRRQIGFGGMGTVYLARDRTLDEVVAIKVLRPDFAANPAMAARFKSEIKLARKVRHRNVGAIHDFGEDRGLLYISMELIQGVDLKQLLASRGRFAPDEAYELSIQIAEGLQAVHDAGVIHRDLKTPNIMRDERGVARLMDFGIAKEHGRAGATVTGTIVGTPEYMSPEQGQGKKVDFRTDVYSFGIVIHELFSGDVPFRADTPIATILRQIQEPPTLEGPGAPDLPAALVPVLRRCLAKDPSQRYATARDVAEALHRARSGSLESQPSSTNGPAAPTITVTPPVRRYRLVVAVPSFLVLLGLAVAVGVWSRRAAPPPTTLSPSPSLAPHVETSLPTPVASHPSPSPAATRHAALVKPAPARSPAPMAPSAVEPGSGFLHIVAVPWADVLVDDQMVGTTPLDKTSLKAGPHRVTLRYPTYESVERTVVIRPGETAKIRFDFRSEGTPKP